MLIINIIIILIINFIIQIYLVTLISSNKDVIKYYGILKILRRQKQPFYKQKNTYNKYYYISKYYNIVKYNNTMVKPQ